MSDFKLMEVQEFKDWLSAQKVSRKIKLIQLHHTYSPSYRHFTGDNHKTLQENMRYFHMKSRGYADIAQQFTIFPDGKIMTGRSIESAPAGIYGANSGAICIEVLGNFDVGGDNMTENQREAVPFYVRLILDKFGLNAKNNVTYHAWWSAAGKSLGDYIKGKSAKTCPGTAFFGGNTRAAYEKNLLPLILNYGKEEKTLEKVTSINDIVWELSSAGIITDGALWIKKCEEDKNIYWLCYKMANKLRGTL